MVNYVWIGMTVIGLVYAMFNGTIDAVNVALFEGAKEAVTICIGLISVLVFWLGMMKIAEGAGLLRGLTKLFYPLARRIFPEVPAGHPALGYILSNVVANMFGLGNASTPLGVKAMEQLYELNGKKNTPSRSMITFLALNTSGLTILPTTIIVIRMNNGSVNPTEILGPVFLATLIATVLTLFIDRYFHFRRTRRGVI